MIKFGFNDHNCDIHSTCCDNDDPARLCMEADINEHARIESNCNNEVSCSLPAHDVSFGAESACCDAGNCGGGGSAWTAHIEFVSWNCSEGKSFDKINIIFIAKTC